MGFSSKRAVREVEFRRRNVPCTKEDGTEERCELRYLFSWETPAKAFQAATKWTANYAFTFAEGHEKARAFASSELWRDAGIRVWGYDDFQEDTPLTETEKAAFFEDDLLLEHAVVASAMVVDKIRGAEAVSTSPLSGSDGSSGPSSTATRKSTRTKRT